MSGCKIASCENDAYRRGQYCSGCDFKFRQTGWADEVLSKWREELNCRPSPNLDCKIASCGNKSFSGGYCKGCGHQRRRSGDSDELISKWRENLNYARSLSTKLRAKHCYLMRNYGISLRRYYEMVKDQGNRCAICRRTKSECGIAWWPVDHNHATERVRGLLCRNCNTSIGFAKENPNVLNSAIEYLLNYA